LESNRRAETRHAKSGGRLIKLDSDPAFVILVFANDRDGTSNFFTGFHISDPQVITVRNHPLHQNKRGAVGCGVRRWAYWLLREAPRRTLLLKEYRRQKREL